jgi:hypothetical protein
MRLILFDSQEKARVNFYPLALNRPLWELRCGMTSLGEKLVSRIGASEVAYFVPEYMADAYRMKVEQPEGLDRIKASFAGPVNDLSVLAGDDLLVVDPRVKAESFDVSASGRSEVGLDDEGSVVYARIAKGDLAKLATGDIGEFVASAKAQLRTVKSGLPMWRYTWDLILANPEQITADFAGVGRSGIEGVVEQPNAIRGSKKDVYIAPGATVHPMVVIDAENGPVLKGLATLARSRLCSARSAVRAIRSGHSAG